MEGESVWIETSYLTNLELIGSVGWDFISSRALHEWFYLQIKEHICTELIKTIDD
jgi:hypothetical protein